MKKFSYACVTMQALITLAYRWTRITFEKFDIKNEISKHYLGNDQ